MFGEQHFKLQQLSEWWGWSVPTLRRIFETESEISIKKGPDAPIIVREGESTEFRERKQKQDTFVVPESLARRVYARMTNQAIPPMPVKVTPAKKSKAAKLVPATA